MRYLLPPPAQCSASLPGRLGAVQAPVSEMCHACLAFPRLRLAQRREDGAAHPPDKIGRVLLDEPVDGAESGAGRSCQAGMASEAGEARRPRTLGITSRP